MEVQKYLGKRVLVPFPERDNFGKLTGNKVMIGGVVTVEPGPNKLLGIPLQVCIDKTPVELNSLNDIILADNEREHTKLSIQLIT